MVCCFQTGFVNSLRFSSEGLRLVAGVGQEHRLGRWWRMKEAKNHVAIVKLIRKDDVTSADVSSESPNTSLVTAQLKT